MTAYAGLLLGGLYLATGSLVLPIVIHALMDLRALALALARRTDRAAAARPAGL